MKWGRIVPIAALVVVAATTAGCATQSGDGGGPESSGDDGIKASSCVDWVTLPTAADRRTESDLVVDAEVTRTDRTVERGGIYDVYEATVTDVSKGSAPGDTIDVISTSDQCTTSGEPVEYVDSDALADEGTYRLYLTKADPDDDSVWRLVVPGAADPLTTG
ncbi:hypothetical protein [Curtobacterium sp. PhB115]|uniref:hypothetical protein n=1 Tax=Curtobacterium sp. PhB115 TaxID=2485173 RepID=UPI000F4B4CCF|nr:hypothetical protein [Curtobacterium sp. PhB115]ROP74759.1 hypothetical protein EDF19_0846 [Curtobacterium sp. PhB115]